MPKRTAEEFKSFKPKDGAKSGKLFDLDGLYLRARIQDGNLIKDWFYKYRIVIDNEVKEEEVSLGSFVTVSLKDARNRQSKAKRFVTKNISPKQNKGNFLDDFQDLTVANESELLGYYWDAWLNNKSANKALSEKTQKNYAKRRAFLDDFGLIKRPIQKITSNDIYKVIERYSWSSPYDAKRTLSNLKSVFYFARRDLDFPKGNPAEGISYSENFRTKEAKNYSAITKDFDELACMLYRIDNVDHEVSERSLGETPRNALRLQVLFCLRNLTMRNLRWSWIDRESMTINIPPEFMKTRNEHSIPLTTHALAILKDQAKISKGKSEFIFPGHDPSLIMSNSWWVLIMKKVGFFKTQSFHGFRATFRTIVDEELDKPIDILEHHLAHEVKDTNGTAYNRTTKLRQRREMLEEWGAWIEAIKEQFKQGGRVARREDSDALLANLKQNSEFSFL